MFSCSVDSLFLTAAVLTHVGNGLHKKRIDPGNAAGFNPLLIVAAAVVHRDPVVFVRIMLKERLPVRYGQIELGVD